jgi:hypothetical protein
MADDVNPTPGFSLSRWSRRKLDAARATEKPVAPAGATAANAEAPAPPPTTAPGTAKPPGQTSLPALPAIDSLSFESDFSAFLQPQVDESLRRQALKKLFSDPRFNVMDGLDVYIDDYGKPDPIAPELVRQLVQSRYLFDPPQTRINDQGEVEEVPREAPPEVAEQHVAETDGDAAAPGAPSPLPTVAGPARAPAVGAEATTPSGSPAGAAANPLPLIANDPT